MAVNTSVVALSSDIYFLHLSLADINPSVFKRKV